ncbi:MAG: MBG domain-containing protein [Sulfitobacter sp.]
MTISRTTIELVSKVLSASDEKVLVTRFALALGTALTPFALAADTLPTGGTVVHGTAQINAPSAGTLTIDQSSDRAVLNWDGFSIGVGNQVNINQPNANSAILNRVTGSATSEIHGNLNANGRVFVVNPNGIFIGPTGNVHAGGFVASTLDIRTDDFVTGNTVFEGNGSSATVENAGNIQVVTGGYAALIGGKVKNSGVIQAPLGFVGLGSGERITLDLAGDGFLQVALPTNSEDDGVDALIENSGTIQANGGTVQISAATARNAARHAINLSGVVEARSVSGRNGRVTLGGGSGGKVTISGSVRTKTYRPAIQVTQSSRPLARPERGGDITITGRDISLTGAELDASGVNGGGNIRIGGNQAGAPGLPTAETLTVTEGSIILADAITQGDGGRVILWSDDTTRFAGDISATGGELGGDGGFAEVSGKLNLSFTGRADLRAPFGKWGELLLDPTDITIVDVIVNPLNELSAASVEAQLGLGDFTINTSTTLADQGQFGSIFVNEALTWTTGSTLTLTADNDIDINAPITAPNGGLTLASFGVDGGIGPAIGTITPSTAADIDVGQFVLTAGVWFQLGAGVADFNANNFVLPPQATLGTTGFLRAQGGAGVSPDPFQIFDVYGLQGMGTVNGGAADFVLANDIDVAAEGANNWFSLDLTANGFTNEGFVPYGYNGIFDGQRNEIQNLFVRQYPVASGNVAPAGLFSAIGDDAIISNLSIVDADIGGGIAGVLAGIDGSALTSGVFVSGTVETYGPAGGGLAGQVPFGDISDVSADVIVTDAIDPSDMSLTAASEVDLGGLIGSTAFSEIDRVKSTGSVTSTFALEANIGGLVGQNGVQSAITDAYSSASVTAANTTPFAEAQIGGLVGDNETGTPGGTIVNGLSTGLVTVGPGYCVGCVSVGGFVGADDPFNESILSSFYNIETSGQPLSGQNGETFGSTNGAGQFEGVFTETTASLADVDAFIFAALVSGWNFGTTWAIPQDGIDHARLYTVDPVITALEQTPPVGSFQYNGSTTGFSAPGDYFGGPLQYLFGPLGDTGDLTVMDDQIILSGANVGAQTFRYPTAFTSDLAQTFDVRSFNNDVTITPAPLTVTVGTAQKDYGDVLTFGQVPFTAATLFGTDTITGGVVDSIGNTTTAAVSQADIPLTLTNLTGTGLGNYAITIVPGSLRINGRPLTVSVDDGTKTYGDTLSFNGDEFTVAGLVNDDTLDTLNITSDGALADAQVIDNPFAILGSDPVGSGLDNYNITIVPGELTVTPAPLIITADDQDKPFGTEFVFTGNEFTVTGLLNADSVDSATLTSDGADADAPLNPAGVAVFISDPNGTGLENYDITLVNGVMFVGPGNLIITANDQTKVYGTTFTFDGSEFTVTGLAEGDSVDSVTLTSDGAIGTAQVSDGPFAIVASDPIGTGLEQYTLFFDNGSFTIVPAPLTVTANDQTKPQGVELTFDGTEFTTEGLQNGDTVDTAVLTSDGAAAAAQIVDSPFDILVGAVTGSGLDNYEIATVNGLLTVENLITPPEINPIPPGGNSLPNPTDIISIGFPGGGGITGNVQNDPGVGPQQDLPDAQQTLDVVDTISTELELAVQSCGSADQDFTNYMACLSESLDTYANALDEIANDLPAGLETVSATIRTASQEVKAATARATRRLASATSEAERRAIRRDAITEARNAISTAKEEIRKSISLIRADDPEVQAIQQRTGARIVQAFDTVDTALVRAVEL